MIVPLLVLAADGDIDPSTGHGPEWGKAAPIALLVIALLGVALFFLIKSMNKQLKKVPATFDPGSEATHAEVEPPTDVADQHVQQRIARADDESADPAIDVSSGDRSPKT